MQNWSREIELGQPGVVVFGLDGPAAVVSIAIDLLGDGQPAPTVVEGVDLRNIVALRFEATQRGEFELQVRAIDAAGCVEATGLRRDVVVH